MEPTLRSLNAMTLVGVTAAFVPEKTNMTVIPRLWGLLRERAPEIGNPVPGPAVGVINCLPAFDAGDDSDGKTELVYMAALPVAGVERLPEGLWATTIAPADYAVFRTSVANDQVNKTIDYAYGAWLPKSGYDRGEGPELEFYAPDFHPIDRPEFDYAIPVRRK